MGQLIIHSSKHGKHKVLYDDEDGQLISKYTWRINKGRHIEGRIKVRIMDWRFDSIDDVIKVKQAYHEKIMALISKLKEFDKMN